MSTTSEAKRHAKALQNLLPELVEGRRTHVIWRDCDQKYRDENPSVGGKKFHNKMVKEYDVRISTIENAAIWLDGLV